MTTSEKLTIRQEVTIPAAPEKIYALLTNGAKFGDATGKPGKGGGMEGAYFSLFGGWVEGRQIELKSNERIVQAWRFADWEPGVYSLVRFTLTPEGDDTRLVMEQEAHPDQFHEHLATNWSGFYFEPMIKHFSV